MSCDHSMDIGVVCRTCLEVQQKIEMQCPAQITTAFPALIQSSSLNDSTCVVEANTVITALGAVTGVLAIFLFGTVTALVVVCIILKKR